MKIQIVVKIHLNENEKTLKILFKDNKYMERLFYEVCNHEQIPPNKVKFTYKNGRVSKYDTARTLGMNDEDNKPIYVHWANKKTDEFPNENNCPVIENCIGTNEDQTVLVKVNFENFHNQKGDITEIYIRQNEIMEDFMIRIRKLRGLQESVRFVTESGCILIEEDVAAKQKAFELDLEQGENIFVYAMQLGGYKA